MLVAPVVFPNCHPPLPECIRVTEFERASGDGGGAGVRIGSAECPSACTLLVDAREHIHAAAIADHAGDDSRACAVEKQISAGGDGCDGTAQRERAGIGEDFGVTTATGEVDGAEEGVVARFIDDGTGGAAGVVADRRGQFDGIAAAIEIEVRSACGAVGERDGFVPSPSAVLFVMRNVPPLTFTPPSKVFVPLKTTVPSPH